MLKIYSWLVGSFLLISVAYAESATSDLNTINVDGNLRIYHFMRNYSNRTLPAQTAFSLGGRINVTIDELLPNTKAVMSLYFAQPLGLNSNDPRRVDNTLPGFGIISFGQAYLQYQNKNILLRVGNQLIETPWVNAADSRIIPITYRGIYGEFYPTQDFKLIGLRINKFKDRTSRHFENKDILGLGAQYKLGNLDTQIWYYHSYGPINLVYFDAGYEFNTNTSIKPLTKVQFLREWGAINGIGYGVLLGAKSDNNELTIGYNIISNILPICEAANDPLYTGSMIASLIDKRSGKAIKITGTHFMVNKQLQLSASYAKYFTGSRLANTNELDFDASYSFSRQLKGLTARYRIGLLDGNPKTGHFIYSRIMLQYSF